MRRSFLILIAGLALAGAPKPAPQIDLRLQLELRTIEAEWLKLEVQIREARERQRILAERAAAAQKKIETACGEEFQPELSPTGEFVCAPKPLPSGRDERKWR